MSTAFIRNTSQALPRVSMARIPMAAFANAHPSAYSSSSWSESAKTAADKLEQAANSLSGETKRTASNLSQHASDAIRMVESHSVLKQDKAPIHALRDGDHVEARFTNSKH